MAGLVFVSQTTKQSLLAATGKTLLQVIAPTNQLVKILGWGIYFDGTDTLILETAADTISKKAVEVEITIGTNDGSFSNILGAVDSNGSKTAILNNVTAIQSIAQTGCSSEPTISGVIDVATVDQKEGKTVFFDQPLIINGGQYVAIKATAQNAVNARAKLICEE